MKKIKKINLPDSVILKRDQMKTISGGVRGCKFSDGEVVVMTCSSDSDCKYFYGEGRCQS